MEINLGLSEGNLFWGSKEAESQENKKGSCRSWRRKCQHKERVSAQADPSVGYPCSLHVALNFLGRNRQFRNKDETGKL